MTNTLSRSVVLRRLCQIAAKVREHEPLIEQTGRMSLAADCFCDQSASPDATSRAEVRAVEHLTGLCLDADRYLFDEAVLEFIEEAVDAAMRRPSVEPKP